jgi:GT2 family glycosyltransferase
MLTQTDQQTPRATGNAEEKRVAVLVTCYNRCQLTLNALNSLYAQKGIEDVDMQVFLVDDGSTDGTALAVRANFPDGHVLRGDGNLFWNGGMRKAFEEALREDFDAYIWFNDDTILQSDALKRILDTSRVARREGRAAIVAGSTADARTGKLSYGGFVRHAQGLNLQLRKIEPHPSRFIACDTVNGNFTLIPREIARAVGNIEPSFRHQFGDVDYGLRARGMGFGVVVAPGFVGHCTEGAKEGTWKDPRAPLRKRWKDLMSPKGVPFAEWLLFTKRHYGWRWMHYAISPYAKTLVSALMSRGQSGLPGT